MCDDCFGVVVVEDVVCFFLLEVLVYWYGVCGEYVGCYG